VYGFRVIDMNPVVANYVLIVRLSEAYSPLYCSIILNKFYLNSFNG